MSNARTPIRRSVRPVAAAIALLGFGVGPDATRWVMVLRTR